MLDFGVVSPFNLVNLHTIRNDQNLNKSHVIKFLLLNLIASKYKTYTKKTQKCLYESKYMSLSNISPTPVYSSMYGL